MKQGFHTTRMRRVGFFEHTPRNRVVAELLHANGFEAVFPSDENPDEIDLWIACITNPVEARRAEEFRSVQPQSPFMALTCRSSGEAAREAAARCNALQPRHVVHLELQDAMSNLIESVFEILEPEATRDPRFDGPRSYSRSYEADEAGTHESAYELAAFLTERGVAHPHRIRIVSAAYEVTDNARRHAYGEDSGSFSIEVEVVRTRIHIVIIDGGSGFDADRVKTDSVPAALPTRGEARPDPGVTSGGLHRLAALTEEHDVQSDEGGTRVEMVFELTPVRFEEEPDDLADTDFLDPDRARELIRALRDGAELGDIAPALALTVGRLLGGASRGF